MQFAEKDDERLFIERTWLHSKDEGRVRGIGCVGEGALEWIYVLRTNLAGDVLERDEVVASYKALACVERVFRGFNTDLDIRPIRHRSEERVRTHVFLRMLSYYVTWHMERSLAPMLFKDDDHDRAEARRTSSVAPALRSANALKKVRTKRTEHDAPVHSFATLLTDLATMTANRVEPGVDNLTAFTVVTTPTAIQRRAFELLGVSHRLGNV